MLEPETPFMASEDEDLDLDAADQHTEEVRRAVIRAQLLAELVVPLAPARLSPAPGPSHVARSRTVPTSATSSRAAPSARMFPAHSAPVQASVSSADARSPLGYDHTRYEAMLNESLTDAIHAASGSRRRRPVADAPTTAEALCVVQSLAAGCDVQTAVSAGLADSDSDSDDDDSASSNGRPSPRPAGEWPSPMATAIEPASDPPPELEGLAELELNEDHSDYYRSSPVAVGPELETSLSASEVDMRPSDAPRNAPWRSRLATIESAGWQTNGNMDEK